MFVDVQFLVLVQCVVYYVLMFIDFLFFGCVYYFGFGWDVLVEEFVEIVFVDEVDVGGIFFGVGWQGCFVCYCVYLFFWQVVDWEQCGGQLCLVQCMQEVGLVFVGVGCVQQLEVFVVFVYLGVVVGGDFFCVQCVCFVQKGFEFDFVVVQYVWVWCVVGVVFGQEVFEYVVLVFGGEVVGMEWDVELVIYGDGVFVVGVGGVWVGVFVFFLVLYEQVFDCMVGLL